MPPAGSPLTVLQLTDTHFLAEAGQKMLGIDTEYYFVQVLGQALADNQQVDLIILSGDLAQDPCPGSYQRLQQHLAKISVPVLCLPGNHDDFELMQTLLNVNNSSCAKQHLFEHWQIICLNSQIPDEPGGYLAASELTLLKQALEDYPQHHALIAMHHHCVPTNSMWMDTMLIGNSVDFLTILQNYHQAKVIITGHIHQELTQQIQHLQILSAPSTCFQFTPNSRNFSIDKTAPGYRKLLLYPDGSLISSVSRLPITLNELNLDGRGYLIDNH
ncbi:MAG: 3',5'-cyclic-AMP phosphodiesterase [Methylococcaceae bacterium]|nr:3',5'-cyclic-AMP phosphodiesterase [Methylococcaceae bacterium]